MTSPAALFIFAPGPLAGAEQVVLTGLHALQDHCELQLIIIKEKRVPECAESFLRALGPTKYSITVIETSRALDPLLIFKLQRQISKASALRPKTIIHTHGHKALFYTLCCLKRSPLVHTHHGDTAVDKKVNYYESLVKFGMNFCDRVIAVSAPMQRTLSEELLSSDRITLIENPISLPLAERSTAPKESGQEVIKLIYAGRLSPEKGILEFLDLFLKSTSIEKFHLTILGDGVLRPQVERLLAKSNSKAVSYLGHQTNVASYLREHDALVLPSFKEGLPMILLEATALGLPVIGSAVGGIPTLVTHQHNGLLFNPNASDEVVKVIEQIPLMIAKLKTGAHQKREEVWQRFGPWQWAKNTLKLYQELT